MKRWITSFLSIAVIAGAVVGIPGIAAAQEEDNPAKQLAEQPAVRHRLLLVKSRFELSPAFEATVNADYKHTVGLGLKIEYHLSNMLSFGVVGLYGVSFDTGLVSRIVDNLPERGSSQDIPGDPTPNKQEYESHLNTMPLHGAVYASITPWYGKLAAFGKAFVNFDFYFQGGLAIAQLDSSCSDAICNDPAPGVIDPERDLEPDGDPNNDPPLNDGIRPGLYLGGGIHVFINNWIALDLTVRDYIFSDNPSGLDFDADRAVTDDDRRFLNHLFMGIGVSFFFPSKARRTP